jgi:hypothetical protein
VSGHHACSLLGLVLHLRSCKSGKERCLSAKPLTLLTAEQMVGKRVLEDGSTSACYAA